jgi:hypothetical protein
MRGFFVPEHKGTMDFGESFGGFMAGKLESWKAGN